MSQEPRKHHYLPEFHSSWWAASDRRLVRYTKPTENKIDIKRVYPSEVGWQRDLYAFADESGRQTQILESGFLKRIDDKAARVLRKLNENYDTPLRPDESGPWTVYIQSLLVRSPIAIALFKAKAHTIYDQILPDIRQAYGSLRSPTDPVTLEEYEAIRGPVDITDMAMRLFPKTILNQNIANFIHDMCWAYRTVPAGQHTLLLSDDPVVRTNGLKTVDGHLAVPLSPNRLFLATWKASTMQKFDQIKTRDIVKMVNHSTACGARQFVIADGFSQTSFIERRFGTLLRPSIVG